jgi:hypothetical protein
LIHSVPASATANWHPLPLETIAEDQERIAEEVLGAANIRTSSALAIARANSFLQRHNQDTATEPNYTTQIQPQTLDLTAESPINITTKTLPLVTKIPANTITNVTQEQPPPTTSPPPTCQSRQLAGGPLTGPSTEQPRFADTDTNGSPVRPSTQFCATFDHQTQVILPRETHRPRRRIDSTATPQSYINETTIFPDHVMEHGLNARRQLYSDTPHRYPTRRTQTDQPLATTGLCTTVRVDKQLGNQLIFLRIITV